jgi:radical SAM superfamily enzyme YgiQ (UPF0313 family)
LRPEWIWTIISGALFSLESRLPLDRFDIIGFSLLYELNYTNILSILELSGIPFYAAQRDASFPLIIAGGPCTCNPEPVADFFDAMVIGDGENVTLQLAEGWMQWKKNSGSDKEALLKRWSKIEGVYIPSFFKPQYDESGFQTLQPQYPNYTQVTRTLIADLDQVPFPEKPIIPFGKPVHDRLRLEVARGCTRGCRFCQAGMIYRPVRERSPDSLLAICDQSVNATGYEDISLLSLSTGDYGCIVPLMSRLMSDYATENVAVRRCAKPGLPLHPRPAASGCGTPSIKISVKLKLWRRSKTPLTWDGGSSNYIL